MAEKTGRVCYGVALVNILAHPNRDQAKMENMLVSPRSMQGAIRYLRTPSSSSAGPRLDANDQCGIPR